MSNISKVLHPAEKPWCICHLGPDAPSQVIRRYANRQDAEDDLRNVTRWIKNGGRYVIAFDVVEAPTD